MQDYVLSILIITKGMWQTLTETSQMEGAVEEINTWVDDIPVTVLVTDVN